METCRRVKRSILGVALAGGLVAATCIPAFALGHRGDSREIASMRGGSSDQGGDGASRGSGAAPEIDAGAFVTAIALVAGGLLFILERHRH